MRLNFVLNEYFYWSLNIYSLLHDRYSVSSDANRYLSAKTLFLLKAGQKNKTQD